MLERLPSKKPWPMKWIVVAILACIVPYTWLTLRYRKPGPAFEPFQDTKERVQLQRLVDAGVRRVTVSLLDPAALESGLAASPPANWQLAPGGVPEALREVLLDSPRSPLTIDQVSASATAQADAPYIVSFTYTTDREQARPTHSAAFLHDREVTVIVEVDASGPSMAVRPATAALRLPPRLFGSGPYTVTLVGQNASQRWQVEAR